MSHGAHWRLAAAAHAEDWNVPVWHVAQRMGAVAPARQKCPSGHGVGSGAELLPQKLPAGHRAHW